MIDLLAQTARPHAFTDFLVKSGPFLAPLLLTSIVGLMAVIYKFLSLTASRVIPPALAQSVASLGGDPASPTAQSALRAFQEGESTLARLAAVAVRHRGQPREEILHAVEASSREESVRLHSGIGVLDVIITVAPLLGLLGTASGLVTIFQGLGESSDNSRIALGIAEALYTTIFGLAIAVPCVVAHGYFLRRIDTLAARLEILLSDVIRACQRADQNP